MTILVSDSFNRANSTATLGSTDSFYGGTSKAWQVSAANGVGTYGISSNQAYCVSATAPNGHNVAYVNAGVSDFWAQATFSTLNDVNGGGPKISLRIQDSQNMINVQVMTTGTLVYTYTNGSSTNYTQWNGTINNGDIIKVHAHGTTIDVYHNGTLVSSDTITLNSTLTTVGIMAYNYPNARFDDFVVADADFTITHNVAPVSTIAVSSTVKSSSSAIGNVTVTGVKQVNGKVISNSLSKGNVTVTGTKAVSGKAISASSAKGNSTVTSRASYLSLNGTSDYISLPSMTITDVYINFEFTAATNTYNMIYESGPNTNTIEWHSDHVATESTMTIANPTTDVVQSINTMINLHASATAFTSASTIGKGDSTAYSSPTNMPMNVYDVKLYNGATLVAHYDMTTGTVNDQTSNGNNATLVGGTWVGGALSVSGKVISKSSGKVTVTASGAVAVSSKVISKSSAIGTVSKSTGLPNVNKTVLVIMENHSESEIIGNSAAPYMTSLANTYANFTNYSAIEHPSQPNYLDIFSGSNQGSTDDNFITSYSINAPNLYTVMNAVGKNVISYMESMPSVGYTGGDDTLYAARHNPASKFSNVPPSTNVPFAGYWPSSNFASLPEISIVVPNLQDDIHDGTIQQGDTWLKNNIDPFLKWAMDNDSLLIIVFDEDDTNASTPNTVPLILAGPMVKKIQESTYYDHYSLLRTMIDLYNGPSYPANSASAVTIASVWSSNTGSYAISNSSAKANATVTISKPVSDSVASHSSATANVTLARPVSDNTSSHSSATANVTLARPVSNSVASHSSATANVTLARPVSAKSVSTSLVTANVAVSKPITAKAISNSTTTNIVKVNKPISATVASTSKSIVNEGSGTMISSTAASSSRATGNISVTKPISGTVVSASNAKNTVKVDKLIGGTVISISSVLTSEVKGGTATSGRILSRSSATCDVSVLKSVSSRAESTSYEYAKASVNKPVSSVSVSNSKASARAYTHIPSTLVQRVNVTVKLTTSVDIQLSF